MTSDAKPQDRLVTLPAGSPDRTLGFLAGQWAQRWLVQPNGPRAGKPFRFTRGQARFLLWWYAVDDDGRWLFDHGVRRLAKGSGKSPFAAVLSLIEFCAPVRLDDFDDDAPGGVRGRPVEMPWVQIAATAESQTVNTMRMVRAFAPKGSDVVAEHRLDPGKQKFHKLPEGTLEIITSSATAAEGAEGSFTIADETEHWTPSNGGRELASTLEDNLSKSGNRMLETSNAWVPGRQSVAEDTYNAWLIQQSGRQRGSSAILYDARIAPPDTRLDDEGSLREALEFVYEDCDWKRPHVDGEPAEERPADVEPMVRRVHSMLSRPDDAKRKYLNWPTAAEDAWVAPEEWDRLARPGVEVADGDEVVLFFDGSKSRDATALVGCRVDDGHVFLVGAWEPDPYDDAVTVDAADVDRVVSKAFDRFDVAAFFGDVQEWQSQVLTEWPDRWRDQLRVWSAPQARPPAAIAWDMRGKGHDFAKAAEACHAEIVEEKFTHDGSAVLSRHVANARRYVYRNTVTVRKESPDSPHKIDAAVCVIGARMVRRLYLESGKRRKRYGQPVFV